jgi:pyrimidine-nucleoside phosphorylase
VNFVELIERKRDGGEFTAEEIAWLMAEYTAGRAPDYQMASLLMAVFKEGLSGDELVAWTEAMLHSGEVLDLSHIPARKVDKHSTGGVGDKVSIALAPMVAACGVVVPMISGRGLGHTGGTLDKLETIPGFRTALDPDEFVAILERTGLVLAGQSETIVPADRNLYALRDATGTVPSIPLIASSIMSKKLAEGIDGLVLDVKVGRGAFMRDLESARRLAETMVGIGTSHGTTTVALLTDMNQPLGRAVGNANEMAEALQVLHGDGPADLHSVVQALAAEMLVLGEVAESTDAARVMLADAVDSGRALEKLAEVAEAQGGDPAVIHDPSLLPAAPHEETITAERDGLVERCDALEIAVAAMRLGAGRATKESDIDPAVGVIVDVRIGDEVGRADRLARIQYRDQERLEEAVRLVRGAIAVGDGPAEAPPLIREEVR